MYKQAGLLTGGQKEKKNETEEFRISQGARKHLGQWEVGEKAVTWESVRKEREDSHGFRALARNCPE